MEISRDAIGLSPHEGHPPLEVRMFGQLTVKRRGADLALPRSRKTRALLAYLSLSPHAVPRSRLSELLWDIPADPRGELRWCLTKLRGLIDEPKCVRVKSTGGTIHLDLTQCVVDALEVSEASASIATAGPTRLRALAAMITGDFLEGLEIPDSPSFTAWIMAKRRVFREAHVLILRRLVDDSDENEAIAHLEDWLRVAPFDERAHTLLLRAFVKRRDIRAAEQHLAVTIAQFSAEGLDGASLRDAWRVVRANCDTAQRLQVGTSDRVDDFADSLPATPHRASVAIMPFAETPAAVTTFGKTGAAFAYDVITRLAKLRCLFVIAPETALALHEQGVGVDAAGELLKIDYVVGGSLRRQRGRISVTAQLTEAKTGRLVWSDVFGDVDDRSEDAFDVLDAIGDSIVASIAGEIEAAERNRAILRPPKSLNAWEAYHCGLWHMYRFNRGDNDRARHFFEQAIQLDRTFARAHSGLSFTHFQNAFQGWTIREPEVERAFEAAGQSLMTDERDPSAHWAMGRALWLRGDFEKSVAELGHTVELSPNFALAHYTLAFVHSQAGDPEAAIAAAEYSCRLSPFDPLLFGMYGARAMALVRLGNFNEAAIWGVKAAAQSNAHAHILAIAALCLALSDRPNESGFYLKSIRRNLPDYHVRDFLTAFRFDHETAQLFRIAAKRIGLA
jgi:DNA-binding SARP family transcriptional activator/TolB-like protein/Flp pilus assembly protein TadD